ncbi:helix-turn-helix domain-containing protein [Pseudomonas helleri]|uniref:helix-turn-helix domain-containing protein n=1 Tax=Pseudomonas helleri TaxID=1608996 RepID=UPI003F94A992
MNNWKVCTAQHPAEQREDIWQQALQQIYLSVSHWPRDGALLGEVTYNISPQGIEFVTLSGSAQRLVGDCPLQPESLWLALVIAGEAHVQIGEQITRLQAGEILYGATGGERVALDLRSDFLVLTLEIPHALFYKRLLNPLSIRAGTLACESGVSRLLASLLSGVAQELSSLDAVAFHPVELALTELLIHALTERTSINTFRIPGHAKHFQEICHCIELHLGDPQLNLVMIAGYCHASARYIQKIFKEAGLGFNQYLRRRRLERCKRDMSSQLNGGLSITEICLRWGFNDLAYFSRSFTAEYGMGPRAYRARQLGQQDPA